MGFKDCLIELVDRGALSKEEAADFADRFDEKFGQAKMSMPEDAAAKAAKDRLAAELRAEAAEARRRAKLADDARGRLKTYLQGYTNQAGKADVFEAALNKIEHYGLGMTTTVTGRAKAIVGLAHGELTDLIRTFRRSRLTGRRFNRPAADAIVKERFGEGSGDEAAKAMSDAAGGVLEKLRQRFNAAGGAVGKLKTYGLPQSHDALALLRAGKTTAEARDNWLGFIKPLLDRDAMLDPLTHEKMDDARFDQVLRFVWGTVATDGMNKLEPAMMKRGRGMIAAQRADHRFLQFKNADAWMTYARQFGNPDPIKAIFDHINGMARDIAAMEEFGPNPGAMMEWLKQVVQREAANKLEGKPSYYNAGRMSLAQQRDKLGYIPWRLDGVWQAVRGGNVVSSRLATGVSNVRNLLTSAQLGAASVIAATTDPFFDALARRLTGLPITKAFGVIAKTFAEGTKENAVRAGIVMDDFVHILGDGARFQGVLGGSEWSKWLTDRTLQLSALEPMTQARKHVFALDVMAALADQADKQLDEIDPMLRRWMEGYGLTRNDWNLIRKTPQFRSQADAGGIIRPADVAALEGGQEPAERMLMMILGQTERAVPSGTVRARSFVTGAAPRGTIAGELLDSFLQYKSFGLSVTTLQLQALMTEWGVSKGRGMTYAASVILAATLGGAMGVQLRQVTTGKDPQPMKDPRFWMSAMGAGGGFGIFGDFLFADQSRYGNSFTEALAGPMMGLIADTMRLGPGSIQKMGMHIFGDAENKAPNFRHDLINFAGKYTPVLSSLFYARTAFKRIILDQLQYAADPGAHKSFREQEKRAARETGQGFWWRPGDLAPTRAPDLGNAAR